MTTLKPGSPRHVVVTALFMGIAVAASARSMVRRPNPCMALAGVTADEARNVPLDAVFNLVGRLAACPQPLPAALLRIQSPYPVRSAVDRVASQRVS